MSHRWEHEDEYIQLSLDINRARREGKMILLGQLQARIGVLDTMRWQAKVACFTELSPYSSLVEGLAHKATELGMPFPDLANKHNKTTDGHFIFGISDGVRSIQIWPMEDRGYYNVELFDYDQAHNERCYKGHTTSLTDATIVLSRWYMERCSIESLHAQCPWLPQEPFRLDGPRMTFGD